MITLVRHYGMRRNLRFEIFPLKVRSCWKIQPGGSNVNNTTESHYLLKHLSLSFT